MLYEYSHDYFINCYTHTIINYEYCINICKSMWDALWTCLINRKVLDYLMGYCHLHNLSRMEP